MSTIARCQGCGQRLVRAAEEMRVEGYVVKRCGGCFTATTDPLPSVEELAKFYASYSDNYSAGMAGSRYEREMPKRWDARLRRIAKHRPRGRLIDLGGANGMFGRMAADAGYDVTIADFVPQPIDLGFTHVQPADLSRRGGVPFPDASFDVATLWSCLEHVREPDTALEEAKRLLVPGGLIAIDTPLVGDLCERAFAARSHWIAPPEHLHVFSARGLRAAAERVGFRVVTHEAFHERTRTRWMMRRTRNIAVALFGAALKAWKPARWASARSASTTPAGDIQLMLAELPASR